MISRRVEWFERLKDYNAAVAETPFMWGVHDCVLYAAGAVFAQTGHDFAKAFRGHYSTELGGARAIRRFGAGTLEASVTALLGDPIHISLVKRGDVVMFDGSLGICLGLKSSFVGQNAAREGLIEVATKTCSHGWTVAF